VIACKSFVLRIFSSVYIGSFSRFTQVLAVGSRSLSLPASRIANFGTSSLNPLLRKREIRSLDEHVLGIGEPHSSGGRLQLVTNLNNALF
jgi:hypothetical protein